MAPIVGSRLRGLSAGAAGRLLNAELMCPICLSVVRETLTVMECLHRFCQASPPPPPSY
jgi:hypothetical protein